MRNAKKFVYVGKNTNVKFVETRARNFHQLPTHELERPADINLIIRYRMTKQLIYWHFRISLSSYSNGFFCNPLNKKNSSETSYHPVKFPYFFSSFENYVCLFFLFFCNFNGWRYNSKHFFIHLHTLIIYVSLINANKVEAHFRCFAKVYNVDNLGERWSTRRCNHCRWQVQWVTRSKKTFLVNRRYTW